LDDFLLHAAFGGDPTLAPLTNAGAFEVQYGLALGGLLASNPDLKGVVGNFPNIFHMPHFTSVAWNAVPLDATTAAMVKASLADNYNAFLEGMVAATIIDEEEKSLRMLTYEAGQNAVLISDETLTDLTPYMAGPYAGLLPYAQARQTKNTDILPFSAATVLGSVVGGEPTQIMGVTVPLPDQYALIPSEIQAIEGARIAFNNAVASVVAANAGRVALADIDQFLGNFVASRAMVANGITLTPNINPP